MSELSRLLAEQEREEQGGESKRMSPPLIIDIPGNRPPTGDQLSVSTEDNFTPGFDRRSPLVVDIPAQDPAEDKTTPTPLSDLLDQQETTPARVGVGLRAGRDGSPDTAAEILGLSKKTGMAPEMVERNLDEVRSLNADQELNAEIDTLAERSPSTAAFLALDRLKAAQASDDVGVLASIEQAVVDTAKAVASEDTANAIIRKGILEPFMGGPYGSLVRSPIELQDLQEKERQELNRRANMFGASLDDKVAAGFANVRSYIPDPLASLARGATYVTQQIDEAVFGAPERTTSEAVQAASKQFQERLKAYAPKAKPGSYNYYVSEIIGSAFGMAPTIALGAVAGPTAGMSELGMRVYGLSYNEGRERGMDPRAASIRASYMAAVEAVTEKIPLEKILEPIVKGGKRGLTQRAKNILASMYLEGAQEGLVSILEIAYDTSLQGMEGIENFDAKKELQKVIDSVIIGGGAGGLTSTATNIVGSVMDKRRASVTQAQTAEQLDRVRESMLRQRSPEAFDEFFQMLSDNNDQGDILVSAAPVMDYLAQAGENPRDFFQQLGVDEETITKAYEAGGDIEIKAGKFFSLMPDNEFRDQILLNLREAAGAPTVAEAEIRSTQMQERMEKMMEEMTSEERTEVNTTTERVRQRFVQDAIAAGRPRADAQNAGAVWDAVFRTSLDAYANDPNRTRPLSEIARELEEQVFNVRARSVAFAERGQPLEQTPQEQRQRFRDTLPDDVLERVVAAANEEATSRIDLGVKFDIFDTFDIDQIIVDELGLAVMEDGYITYGQLSSADIAIPDDAVEGDRLPIEAVLDDALLRFNDGSQTEGRFWRRDAEDDFEIDITQLYRNDDGTIDLDETFVDLVPKDLDALARRYGDQRIAESQVDTVEDALNHEDHLVRAKAFGALLDELGIDYTTEGSDVASYYYMVGTGTYDAEIEEYDDFIKVRFADHENQSRNHPTADFNVADEGYDTAIDAMNFIFRERGMIEDDQSFQNVDTTSANFRNWFRASKIVDANGAPLVVYHGTDTGFLEFDPDMLGEVSGSSDSLEGFWFSTNRDRAKEAAADAMALSGTNMPYIMELYLSVQNPFYGGSLKGMDTEDSAKIIREAKAAGHDGVIFNGEMEGQDIIVFEPTQIKSAQNYRPSGTYDTSDANILHQTITDATGKPLAVVHNISEEKLRHAVKMGGLPVPSLAIVDANQEFTNFGNIQLVGAPSMVDPRASRKNRVFNADIYSPRYPSGDIERTVDRDAADALQADLFPELRPGWLSSTLADTGTKGFFDQPEIQRAFLRSIGVDDKYRRNAEDKPEKFNQFIENTFGSLITRERILDQITDTGRRYLPHNLDNVVRIMKRELRGGERFVYGVGNIRAQVAKQFKSLKQIKDARESIVTEGDMQAFKDDTDDAFGALAQELSPFYSGDPNQFGFLDVVVDLLSGYARRGERALDDSGFENVSDEAKQRIVNFLANLRQAPTEYFEAKIQRAVGLDEFQGAIVQPETPQDIRTLLEENGLRVIEATDRSEALQQYFANELFQTPSDENQLAAAQARLRDEPESLGLTPERAARVNNIYRPETLPTERLPSNREAALWLESQFVGEPITDMTQELTDEQLEETAQIMAAETQLGLEKSGSAFDWYTAAIERAVDIIKIKYPMVADDAAAAEAGLGTSKNARFVLTYIMAVTSQNLDVAANAVATDQAFGQMLDLVRSGIYSMPREWGTGDKQEAMGDNFDKFGPMIEAMPGDTFPEKIEALDGLFRESMTVKKWVDLMKERGVPYNAPGQTAVDAVVYGSAALGPKIGNGFWQNLNGNFDPLTIDLWMRRTWGRLTGTSIGNPGALPAQRQRLKDSIKRSRSRAHGDPDHIALAVERVAELENIIETRDPTTFVADLVDEIATIEEDTFTQEARLELAALNVETFTGSILEQIAALNPDDFENRKAFNEAKRALREEVKRVKAIYADEKARVRDDIKRAKVDFRDEKQRLRDALRDRKAAFVNEGKRLKRELEIAAETIPDLRNIKAPEPYSNEYDNSPEDLLEYAKRVLSVWDAEYKRLKETSNSGKVPADLQPTWARAAKTIVTNLGKPLDQVANGTQRKQIEAAGARALQILSDAGVPITMADMQAVLWYPEKDLWGALTSELATDEDGLPIVPPSDLNESYDTVFARILRSQGYEIEGAAGDRAGGDGAGAVAGQDVQLEGSESAEGTGRNRQDDPGQEELFHTIGHNQPPPSGIGRLYSQAQRATQSLTQQKATASQWLSHFKKNGVKDDEINWIVGLPEFLNSQKTIDKDDLSAFIEQNGIKLDEVELGGPDPEIPASLAAANENLLELGNELNRLHDILYSALAQIESMSVELIQNTIDFAAERGPTIVSDLGEQSPGIFKKAQEFFKAAGEHRVAMEKTDEEVRRYEGTRKLPPKFASRSYVTSGPLEAEHQEFYLTLPADLTEGNADIQDWLVPAGHEIGQEDADNRLVIRIRASGRILEDGRRVLHIDEMQDDRGQAAEAQGVAEHIPNLQARRNAFNLLWYNARQVIASGPGSDYPSRYLLDAAVTHTQVFPDQKWTENYAFDGANFTPEQIEIVDKYIAAVESEPNSVKTAYDPPGIPNRPFLGSNKVIPLALKRMMIEATERGYDAISWTSGDTQNARWGLDKAVDKVEVLDVTDDEAMIVVNQTGFGSIALEGAQTQDETFALEYELRQDENGEWEIVDDGAVVEYGFPTREDAEEALDIIRQYDEDVGLTGGRIINMVPIDMLPQIFNKSFADKIVEGGRNQSYTDLDLRVGGEGMKKFYDNIVRNDANDIGKKFKPNPRTGVGRIIVEEATPDPGGEFKVKQGSLVSPGNFTVIPEGYEELAGDNLTFGVMRPDGSLLESFLDRESAENYARMFNEAQQGELPAVTEDVWVFPLTPEIKDTILGEGLPMMQDPDDPMGSFDPVRKVINLFEQANYSTLLHESGHAFVHIMEELSKRDDAPARITENYQAMLDWVGAANASDLDIRVHGEAAREKQERLARAFEAYLREGKAPSAKLQSAFSQFREWLKKIYQNMTQLNVTMDDEIRTVFDRMLATDAEIDDMIAVNEFSMEDSPSILNMMSAEEREKAQGLQLRARDRAVEARALEQERFDAVMASDKYAEEMAGVVDELTPVVMRERKYASFYFLTNGEYYGDRETPDELKDKRISRQALLDAGFTKEQLQALPRANGKGGRALYSAKETEAMDPEILAVFLGYESGRELIDDMMGVTYPDDEIARRAEEIMASRPDYTDPVNDGTMKQITEDALYNAEQAELIEMELDALARAAGTQRESRVFLQAVADRLFKDEPIGTMLSQVKFAAASRRAARASEQAANKENWQKAFEEKRKEILNFELHRRAVKAKYEVAKIQAKLNNYKRRKQDPRKVAPDYVKQVAALLEFYEFGRPSATGQIKPETASRVVEFIEMRVSKGAQVLLPGDLIEVADLDPDSGEPRYVLRTKFWKDMTLPELRALRDLADNLMKQGRNSSQSAKEARRQRGEELAEGILDRTRYRRKKLEKTRTYSRNETIANLQRAATFAEHRKLESMIRQLDGFEPLGPMYDAVFLRLAEASDNKAHLVTMILKMQNETGLLLTEEQRKTFNTSKSDVPIQALGGLPMRLEDRLAIALNWGSESSREAVLDDRAKIDTYGMNWNEDAINEILSTLDDNALNYVEATWQFIDLFWDDITLPNGRTVNGTKTLELETTGVVSPKIEASPFFVNGRQMSGGYYPLVYDNLSDVRVARETEAELMDRMQAGGFARAHTTHGFTIARVGSGGRPIRTDLGVINKHLDEVTQDLCYRIAVQEAAWVLGDPSVISAIEQTMGRPFRENMQEILVRTATGQLNSNEMGSFNKIIANARINMTTAIMGLNLRSIGTQPFGLLQSINEIGVKEVGVGMAWLYKRQTRLNDRIAEIHAMSPYMAERATTMTRELDDIANSLQRRKKMDRIREWGFKPMVYIDVVSVAYPTWYGAYNKAMSGRVEGIDASNPQYTTSNQYTDLELKAIAYADMVVRMTQSAGSAQNLSMVQQRSETMKLMTMMYSYFNTTYNLQAEAFAKARADGSSIPKAVMKPSFIASTMLLQTLPALMASLVLDPWPDEDEAEEDPLFAWAKWSLKSLFSYVTGEFVFVRDFGSAVTHPFFGFSITPLESMAESAARLPGQIDKTIEADFSEEAVSSLAKKFTQVVGGVAGIPGSNQIAKTSDYLYKWSQGTLKNEPDTVAEGVYKSLFHGDR